MTVELFAGNRVSDFEAAKAWYVRLLGAEPSFLPHDTEAVWELAEHRYLYIVEEAGAGGSVQLIWVDDLDATVAAIGERGLEPDERETYAGKAQKAIYRDPDGNEVAFGGQPPQS